MCTSMTSTSRTSSTIAWATVSGVRTVLPFCSWAEVKAAEVVVRCATTNFTMCMKKTSMIVHALAHISFVSGRRIFCFRELGVGVHRLINMFNWHETHV